MRIIVCMKQVPASSQVEIDPESGSLKRLGAETKTNPYDLYALEAAVRIRDSVGGCVIALTMGPDQTESMMRDAYMMGADETVILSDRKFAGSDVLATSFTLAQGISCIGGADLIICGRQTTDGDTAQIGPAIAEQLGIAHAAWASEIVSVSDTAIQVVQDFGAVRQKSELKLPCLITVDKDINVPRLPSYRLKKAAENKTVRRLSLDDLPCCDLSRYGLIGSPTAVEAMFAPPVKESSVFVEGSSGEKARKLYELLRDKKYI